MSEEIKLQIQLELFTKSGTVNSAIIRRDWFRKSDLYDSIMELTSFLNFKNPKFTERIWCIMHGITSHPKCEVCGTNAVFLPNKDRGYSKTCSEQRCSTKLSSTKVQDTKLKKYGDKHFRNPDKAKKTCLEKYGVENPFQSAEIQNKVKDTVLDKYGVENISQSEEVKEKVSNSLLERFGVKNVWEIESNAEKVRNRRLYKFQYMNEDVEVINVEKRHNDTRQLFWVEFKCNECGRDQTLKGETFKWRCDQKINPCISCSMLNIGSLKQRELYEYISSMTDDAILYGDRGLLENRELDLYIPSKNLAFEFDGIFWHSHNKNETTEERNYHLLKTEKCEGKGVHLIHIFETDWDYKKEIVKSRISSALGKNKSIPARKCFVSELSKGEAKQFFAETHIQGNCGFNTGYKLVFEGEIVAAMTFGVPRFNKMFEWELLRYSNKLYTNVVGGAGKLFKHFIRNHNPNNVVSYADRKWTSIHKSMYLSLGFVIDRKSNPNYFYFDKSEEKISLQNRIKFQKHKLPNILDNFDSELTESENMFNNGYRRIWDCGNLVFLWHK